MPRVFVDTNVLFPFSVMDLMLALTEDAIHEVLWTDTLLAEWERVIVRQERRSASSASAITKAIREYFPEGGVPEVAYAHLIKSMPNPDPDDQHHIAAAVAGRADALVTWNLSDFPAEALSQWDLQVLDPDTYLCGLLSAQPLEVTKTVVRLAAEKKRPQLTAQDLAASFAKAGAVAFAKRLRSELAH